VSNRSDNGDDRDTLRRLEAELKRARESSKIAPPREEAERPPTAGLGMAMRIGAEMVAGVGVGAGVGYGLDRWLGTSPWLLIVFFFLGAGAGTLNTYRAITGAGFGLLGGGEGGGKSETKEDGS
jgi:ATP synthase protein I